MDLPTVKTPAPVCIYCHVPLPSSIGDEHVLTKAAFGEFNFVLDCVCQECNGLFGKTLELILERHSMEAVLRFDAGLCTGTLNGMGRLEIRIADEGPWKGVRINLKARKGKKGAEAVLVPQFGARRGADAEWEWFKVKEITPDIAARYAKGSEFQVVATNVREQDAIIARLKKAGVDFHPKRTMPTPIGIDGKIGAKLEALFSEQVRRCIAKQAFNYLAKVKGAEFVLRPDFDDIRSYIRYGTKPPVEVVRPMGGSFLLEKRYGSVATRGHILSVDWSPDNQSVVTRLALFNTMKYLVVLTNHYRGVWIPDLAQAHHFDIETRVVKPLSVTRLHIPTVSAVRVPRFRAG